MPKKKTDSPEAAEAMETVETVETTQGEELVFGATDVDPTSTVETVQSTVAESDDSFVGLDENVPPEIAAPAPAPMPAREVSDDAVFGQGSTVEQAASREREITLPLSVLEQMQERLAKLEASQTGDVIDPLSTKPKAKHLNATFYVDDQGKQWLVLDMMEKVFPNGTTARVYQDGVDAEKKPVYKAILKVADVETGIEKNVEVVYENFIKLSTPMKVEAVRVNESPVDLTPSDEVVEITTYQENGNYIRPVGTGAMVALRAVGKVQRFVVEVNGKTFELSSDVVNIK